MNIVGLLAWDESAAEWKNLKVTSAGNLQVAVSESNIIMPVDRQATYRAFFTDSTTSLAAGASFTGSTRDAQYYTQFRAKAYADQAGTLYIQQSRDGSTWRTTHSIAVGAGETQQIVADLVDRYCRVHYVNGATDQAAFELTSSLNP
ncbi:TPA: hypothetical protein EYP37_07975 [Candidatus Poribacteria bacterium]|nr:hypothetical protein [Candidatus Poribacteria bacterium]